MKPPVYRETHVPFYKRKTFLVGLLALFFITIMALSAVEVGLNGTSEQKVEYQGLEFVQTDQGWLAYLDDRQLLIQYSPNDLQDIRLDPVDFYSLNYMEKVYVSINPYDDIQSALVDFQRNIPLNTRIVTACYEDNDLCADSVIKTCDDATDTVGIIMFRQANESVVSFENNCLTIEGKDLLKVVDTLVLDQYGEG